MENEMSGTQEDRLTGAVEHLLDRLESLHASMAEAAAIGPIVATIENEREVELERRLAEAETTIAELRAAASAATPAIAPGRKTLSAGMTSMLAKQGLTGESVGGMEAGALDVALTSLSIEQRIAVKSELLRAGILR